MHYIPLHSSESTHELCVKNRLKYDSIKSQTALTVPHIQSTHHNQFINSLVASQMWKVCNMSSCGNICKNKYNLGATAVGNGFHFGWMVILFLYFIFRKNTSTLFSNVLTLTNVSNVSLQT